MAAGSSKHRAREVIISVLRTLENGIDRDHLRTLVTNLHTCSSPNGTCQLSLTNSAHLVMRAVDILSLLTASMLSQNRWTHVVEAMCMWPLLVHHSVMRQREVMLLLLGRLLQIDLHMHTMLFHKEDRAEVLRVITTMGLRQVNQHSHIRTPQITQPLMPIPPTHLATSLSPRTGSTKIIISLISLLTLRRMVLIMMINRWRMML